MEEGGNNSSSTNSSNDGGSDCCDTSDSFHKTACVSDSSNGCISSVACCKSIIGLEWNENLHLMAIQLLKRLIS